MSGGLSCLASYPKSGSPWLRVLTANFLQGIIGDRQHRLRPTHLKTIMDPPGDVMRRFGYLDDDHGQPLKRCDRPEIWR